MKPTKNRVILTRVKEEEKTRGGIILPDSGKEKPNKGVIVALAQNDSPDMKVGDTVLFGQYGFDKFTLEGTDYLVMKESDVLVVL